MKDIVRQVRRVTDLIAAITAATTEQSTGIRAVNDAIVPTHAGSRRRGIVFPRLPS
jgi:methyl-accepting chemotaxis protein